MLKAGTFIIGLTSGLYLGVYLREQGYSSGLTRAYYAYRNEDYNKKGPKNKATVDDLFEYYRNGLLEGEQLEKFKEILDKKNYSTVDQAVISDIDKIFQDPALAEIKKKYNNRLYDK